MAFGIYSALLAYLIGEGQSLSQLITGTTGYALYFSIGFWLIMTLLLREGLRGLKRVETWGEIAVIAIVIGIFIWFLPSIELSNLTTINTAEFFTPLGVVLFALLGFSVIPELKMELKGQEKDLKKAILLGVTIPIVLYLLFTAIFVGVLGKNITQVATLSFGPIANLLGIFTMMTAFFSLSFSLKDSYKFDLKLNKVYRFAFVSLFPLLLFLFVFFTGIAGFVRVLGIGGAISGGLTGIMILLINHKSKEKGDRKPEYSMKINKLIIALLSIIFIAGILIEIF
jgi:tyrosine-specific transport protein